MLNLGQRDVEEWLSNGVVVVLSSFDVTTISEEPLVVTLQCSQCP